MVSDGAPREDGTLILELRSTIRPGLPFALIDHLGVGDCGSSSDRNDDRNCLCGSSSNRNDDRNCFRNRSSGCVIRGAISTGASKFASVVRPLTQFITFGVFGGVCICRVVTILRCRIALESNPWFLFSIWFVSDKTWHDRIKFVGHNKRESLAILFTCAFAVIPFIREMPTSFLLYHS